MRKPVISANWKMNLTIQEAKDLANEFKKECGNNSEKELIVFASCLHIPDLVKIFENTCIKLGGQNIYFENSGAFTGETSAFQLKEAGVSHTLVGHSERRHYFNEDYETVNKKVKKALETGLKVMLCVGETLEDREAEVTEAIVVDQLESAFQDISVDRLKDLYIAYEPVWAIGTGKNATPEDAAHVHEIIRKTIARIYNEDETDKMRILYGGSVKSKNVKSLMKKEQIDGALVGGASLSYDAFKPIINYDH